MPKINTQKWRKCRLCSDKDETVNHMISEFSKLARKEYKSKQDSLEKVGPLGIVHEIKNLPC